ncbi:MAG TPA: Clp protease N-terminal domain-containing protein [Azospirillaceae bacterium]|nr:Clp protease N-terminal domain-containing protein [Azospirillaceae bacterium]
MLNGVRRRIADMRTIAALCRAAERHALLDQQREPGAEHFLLAALDLPDGTARLAFERAGADPAGLAPAIRSQYQDALRAVGVGLAMPPAEAVSPAPGAYRASASGQELMRELTAGRSDHAPLLGAHVVAVAAGFRLGVVARALRAMGADPAALRTAAEAVTLAGARAAS